MWRKTAKAAATLLAQIATGHATRRQTVLGAII
jgi:hypothetical protein